MVHYISGKQNKTKPEEVVSGDENLGSEPVKEKAEKEAAGFAYKPYSSI